MYERLSRSPWLKRALDFSGALLGVIVFSPVILLFALLIRITMGSPVFFCQLRPGIDGKPFRMCKFRTMTNERDESGELLPDDKRLTHLGEFMRSTSLDELPELFNVLKGDMSLVGPRPLLMEYLDYYTAEQTRRHEVKPGITGWAQVNGRNAQTWEERFERDVWYVDNWNLLLDLKIIMMTLVKVIRREGVSHEGHKTMPKFTGPSRD